MAVFSQKLDLLPATASSAAWVDTSPLARHLRDSRRRHAIAVGSGGSAVAAEFLRLCRSTLSRGPTTVQTPLAFTMDLSSLQDSDVWLFSASGDNHDILAALGAARSRCAKSVTIITSNPEARLIGAAEGTRNLTVVATPRAEPKDGFLATHSLVGALVCLLKASAAVAHDGATPDLLDEIVTTTTKRLSSQARAEWTTLLEPARTASVIIVLHDPRLAAPAVLLDTSLWEAAISAVQTTDFRNFAHGRHVWLARRNDAFVLALTGTETRPIWDQIDTALPNNFQRLTRDYGRCARFDGYLAILDGFGAIEALSTAREIDPGKPGVGEFGRPIYEADTLTQLSSVLTAPVRQKRFTRARDDTLGIEDGDLPTAHRELLRRLATATFGGLVLDYDGTVVTTPKRLEPPTPEMLTALVTLLNQGLKLGIATGRGGSAGEMLRDVLPPEHHAAIIMGYYNGAHIAPLSQDIRNAPPDRHPAITSAVAWARSRPDLFSGEFKDSRVQATIAAERVRCADTFLAAFAEAPFEGHSQLKLVQSRHSFDLCIMEACKTNVVNAVRSEIEPGQEVLCIGDSGGSSGNDHIMLGLPFGISVDHVCSREHVGWSLFGAECIGPDALLRILAAMTADPQGGFGVNAELLVDA